jgi:hypothetical protein
MTITPYGEATNHKGIPTYTQIRIEAIPLCIGVCMQVCGFVMRLAIAKITYKTMLI